MNKPDPRYDGHDRVLVDAFLSHRRREHGDHCPTADQIVAFANGTIDADDVAFVRAAVATCDQCFQLWLATADQREGDLQITPAHAAQPVPTSPPTALADALASPPATQAMGTRSIPIALAASMAIGAVALGVWDTSIRLSPLPEYRLSVTEERTMRGGSGGEGASPVVALRDGTAFEILLRPATSIDYVVETREYAVTDTGDLRSIEINSARFESGVVAYQGVIGDTVATSPSDRGIVVVVGREGRLPSEGALENRLTKASLNGRHWSAWRFALEGDLGSLDCPPQTARDSC